MEPDFFDTDMVHDRASFMQFIDWFCADRREAEAIERSDVERYKWGGANGWQNTSISDFLESAAVGAEAQKDFGNGPNLSWRDLAVFLYLGKIYE